MKLIVGLGNPGREYDKTRHNAGFMAIDRLAQRATSFPSWRQRFGGEICEATFGSTRALLLKPMRFMNCSGTSVQESLSFYKINLADMLVLVDDYALPCGQIRIRASGGHGGHNGLRDIDRALATQEYARLRIGIDPKPQGFDDLADWVLGVFTPEQLTALAPALVKAAEACEVFAKDGLVKAMNTFNAK
jgi:peptidyl-tRNA hydrolase, PTH1 family